MKKVIALCFLVSTAVSAWEGYDYTTGNYVEIGSGNLVRAGEDIELYDYATGSYNYVTVEGFDYSGDLEVYDYTTGQYRYLDMD